MDSLPTGAEKVTGMKYFKLTSAKTLFRWNKMFTINVKSKGYWMYFCDKDEPTAMTPDELNAYRILVGPTNVRRAKIAVDQARQGRGLAGPIASAYYPIMQMIDDIASGGFTFVKLLQNIADRARRNKK